MCATGLKGCGVPSTDERHSCPYQEEINNIDDADYCVCCDECEKVCAEEI